jgi:transcriptional regulator with XRE-family HTH domain
VTQRELAEKMGVRQASVSGFEKREDIQLSTLKRIVAALGGRLQIFATFPEGKFALDDETAFGIERECDANDSVSVCTEELVCILRATSAWKLDSGGCLEKAVDWGARVKRNHALLEIP